MRQSRFDETIRRLETKSMNPISTDILEKFGLSSSRIERKFTTDLGAPKAVVSVTAFLGSLGKTWPHKEHLEWVLKRLNAIGRRLASEGAVAEVGPYLFTPAGDVVVLDGEWHYFLTSFFSGREAGPGDGRLLARVMGEFHRAGAFLIEGQTEDARRRRSVVRQLRDYVLPTLTKAVDTGITEGGDALTNLIERVHWLLDNRAAEIDALPVCYCHGDFQLKNILIDDRSSDRIAVRIVDPGGAGVESRLHDLYFLVMGDDDGALVSDHQALRQRMAEYQQYGGVLGDDELHLLPNAVQCKAAAVAAWSVEIFERSPKARQQILARYFTIAMRCVSETHINRDHIRSAVQLGRTCG